MDRSAARLVPVRQGRAERNLCASRGALASESLAVVLQDTRELRVQHGHALCSAATPKGVFMANVQTSKSANDKNKTSRRSASEASESETGERDETYNLISVLYHALQGAETIRQYQQDTEQSGDEQLSQFFEETRQGYMEFAQQAKKLLAERMEDEDADDDEE
jgi:hypothetical protein